MVRRAAVLTAVAGVLLAAFAADAQTLYKYRGPDGEWIYTDRPPEDGAEAEIRALARTPQKGSLAVRVTDAGRAVRFVADNRFHVSIQLRLRLSDLVNVVAPDSNHELTWVLPPASVTELLLLDKIDNGRRPGVEYEYEYIAGDPRATHRPPRPYRVPFAVATNFPVTQAYPDTVTHTTPDSRYAVDIAMPIGTNVFAAREGVVFDVSSDNFKSGMDLSRDGPAANVVQILHDDGTYAVYAHLNWNSIRVKTGQRVVRGQYIADSGNTGFSSGPHLHFVVLKNAGMRAESVPVRFEGANASAVLPASGALLTAY